MSVRRVKTCPLKSIRAGNSICEQGDYESVARPEQIIQEFESSEM
jgi:hypothetical protein